MSVNLSQVYCSGMTNSQSCSAPCMSPTPVRLETGDKSDCDSQCSVRMNTNRGNGGEGSVFGGARANPVHQSIFSAWHVRSRKIRIGGGVCLHHDGKRMLGRMTVSAQRARDSESESPKPCYPARGLSARARVCMVKLVGARTACDMVGDMFKWREGAQLG